MHHPHPAFDPRKKYRVFVLGAGAYGTALSLVLAGKEYAVTLWGHTPEHIDDIRRVRENRRLLPGVAVPESIALTSRLEDAAGAWDAIVMAVPTQHVRAVLQQAKAHLPPDAPVVSVAKGIERGTHLRPSQVIRDVLGNRMPVAILSGPAHAEEVARGVPTSVVAASHDEPTARFVQALFNTPRHRVYTNDDMLGVELAGALKNIIAIAAGISDGLRFGDNTKAALMTRGLVEITRLGAALGARQSTFHGLAGMGDMIATCASRHSRNRGCGEQIGQGRTLDQVLAASAKAIEGVWTIQAVLPLLREKNVDMPITEELHRILFEGKNVQQAIHDLMTRATRDEIDRG